MTERRTAIVIGAGASAECDLPVGAKLKTRIAQLLDIRFEFASNQISGDHSILRSLGSKGYSKR